MIFLNPAILFGMFAASIPLLIHLLNLRKLRKVEFSTLAFLKDIQKTKIRRIKLKQWILLILRMLIIAVIVASFARPALKETGLGAAASSAKSSAVFVLDNSFSMSRISGEGSLLNRAKAAAFQILDKFEPGDEIALITVAGAVNSKSFTHDKSSIIKSLDKITEAKNSGDLESALRKAFSLLSTSTNINKEVYLLTDLQKSTVYSATKGQSKTKAPESSRLYTVILPGEQTRNFAVTDVRAENQIFELGKTIQISAVVRNLSTVGESETIAFLYINGRRSAQQSVSLKPGESKLVTFETELKERGLLKIFVELEEDDIAADNQRFLSVNVPEVIELGFFSDQPSDFLNMVFNENLLSDNLRISKYNLRQLQAVDITRFSGIILNGAPIGSGVNIAKDYLQSGGRLLIIPEKEEPEQAFKTFCAALGLPSNFKLIESPRPQDYSSFDKVNFEHPILRNLFEARGKSEIESPELRKYFGIKPAGRGKAIISQLGGSAFLSEYKVGKGRVLIMNSAADLSWNDFPLKGIFAPLIYKSILYITSSAGESKSVTAGSFAEIDISTAASPRLKIIKPNGNAEFMDISNKNSGKIMEYRSTGETGVYSVFSGSRMLDHFSVNFDPKESEVRAAETNDLEILLTKLNFSGPVVNLDLNSELVEQIYQTRYGAELWRYFLIISLVLILIEMFLSRSVKRDIAAA